ncbi:MAG TPA: DJ-1/PfpI family protein [Acidimicrobiales bacterium]|nr:DJ-1/PfpI family protein [Acidimicrobiales bacterium]
MTERQMRIGVVLFGGFELLDVTGPLECLCGLPEYFDVVLVGPEAGPVASAQGPALVADSAWSTASDVDIVMVPGGQGTRLLADDATFCSWLAEWSADASLVTSVCTGSGLLASAGLLDGYRATSNKRSFAWVTGRGPNVDWVPKARWVHDRDRWTSAGVAAGIDMTFALIAELHGDGLATRLAEQIEYDWHRDAGWDPFAAINGLVDG